MYLKLINDPEGKWKNAEQLSKLAFQQHQPEVISN
jgi:hypothetical protein